MRFVEETGGAWTAEQLKAAEAEIEQKKREWEANRIATLQKEEELAKQQEEEENNMLTYSRAQNQVNQNKIKPLNKRLAKVKNIDKKKVVSKAVPLSNSKRSLRRSTKAVTKATNSDLLVRSSFRRNRSNDSMSKSISPKRSPPVKSKLNNSTSNMNSRTIKSIKKEESTVMKRRSLRKSLVSTGDNSSNDDKSPSIDENDSDSDSKNNTDDEDDEEEESSSECSLNVMIDSNDTNNCGNSNTPSELIDQSIDSYAGFTDHLNNINHDKSREHFDDKLMTPNDVNSPRTRSRGTVKINLWTLDENSILPDVRTVKKEKKSETNTNVQVKMHNIVDDSVIEIENGVNDHYNDDDSDTICNKKQQLPPKKMIKLSSEMLKKNIKRNNNAKQITIAGNNGKSTVTLDNWVLKSPRVEIKRTSAGKKLESPLLDNSAPVVSKPTVSIENSVELLPARKTRHYSLYLTNHEDGPT